MLQPGRQRLLELEDRREKVAVLDHARQRLPVSIAEAHFTPGHWMRAIYADGQPVGFVLTFENPSEGYFRWRFMIAEGHQRRGIGRHAMQQVLEHWRELGATAARTSVVPSNTGATRLYESLGFRLTGEEDDGELVMTLDM